jgi:hypothetical protein
LALTSPLVVEIPNKFRNFLDQGVDGARNETLHQGAFARPLTKHAIELAIILEDALSQQVNQVVMDFMVRNPLCAELWKPIGFIRQQMLANSFS